MESLKSERSGKVLEEALAYCRETGREKILVACPDGLERSEAIWLLGQPEVVGLVLPPDNLPDLEDAPVGRFVSAEYTWRLPDVSCRTIVHIGPRNRISLRMIRKAVKSCGMSRIIYGLPGMWQTESVPGFVGRRVVERGQWAVVRLSEHVRQKMLDHVPGSASVLAALQWPARLSMNVRIRRQLRKFMHEARIPLLPAHDFVSDRILFANSALAWGGAERQLVNTMLSLKQNGCEDLALVCEHLDLSEDHRFFRHQLDGMAVDQLGTEGLAGVSGLSETILERLKVAVGHLPKDLSEDVFRYALHFLQRRPGVVHAWQDSTSIKAGLAALLAGVPKIILSGRNLAPFHFAYHQYYMRPAYRLLADSPRVILLNNSRAGAKDYEQWLGISGIRVLYNGVKRNFISMPPKEQSVRYREELGIPPGGRLVGSIFRFYGEKDPMLWIEAAEIMARRDPDLWFLIIGTGPMRKKMLEQAGKGRLGRRLIMPGTHKNPAVPLSIMDVFLLTSRYEGTPNVLMEAQMLGLPVVTTDAGGARETLIEGRTGLVAKSRDPEEIARITLRVMGDKRWRERAAALGPAFVEERFGLERMTEELLDIYGLFSMPGRRKNAV